MSSPCTPEPGSVRGAVGGDGRVWVQPLHALLALGPDRALVGPSDPLVAAEAEGVADGVGVDAPAVAVGADGVLLQGRAQGQDTALLGLDVVDFEVEMELLGVLAVGPLRGEVVLHPD